MSHWSEFLAFALCHAEAMKYAQIAVDPMAMMQAMAQAQQQMRQASSVLSQPFDRRLISG